MPDSNSGTGPLKGPRSTQPEELFETKEVSKMQSLRVLCLLTAVSVMTFAPTSLSAEEPMSAEKAHAEMKEMFGGVPSLFQVYPKSAMGAGWALMKSTDLNKNTALTGKERELIALGVAAQIPCDYCIYYHTKAAAAQGASEEEIREAVHMSSLVRHWSTVLQGNQYDLDAFKAETDAAFKTE